MGLETGSLPGKPVDLAGLVPILYTVYYDHCVTKPCFSSSPLALLTGFCCRVLHDSGCTELD